MGTAAHSSVEELISKALKPDNGPQWLVRQLHHCGVDRDAAMQAAEAYAAQSSVVPAKLKALVEKVYRKPVTKPQAVRILSIVNAQTIQNTEYTEPIFVVEKILHEGATIVASRPKFGKSWLALQIGIAVATGTNALGRFRVIRPGRVLYLALEDTPRRIHDRLAALLPAETDLSRIDFLFELPEKLGDGGELRISEHLRQHPGEYSLVIIDTLFAAFAATARRDVVKVDYEKLEVLRKLAQEHGVALLLIHHQNKGKDQSPVDSINGTTGVTAAVDSLLVLEEKSGNKLMHIKSRETEDASLALRFDLDTGGWSVMGDAEEAVQSSARKEILRILNDAQAPMYPAAIAKALHKNPSTVRGLLKKLRDDGVLQTIPDGALWFARRPVPSDYSSKPVFASPTDREPSDPDDIPVFG
jgi:DNA-binding transcriptional ArsR family regulator